MNLQKRRQRLRIAVVLLLLVASVFTRAGYGATDREMLIVLVAAPFFPVCLLLVTLMPSAQDIQHQSNLTIGAKSSWLDRLCAWLARGTGNLFIGFALLLQVVATVLFATCCYAMLTSLAVLGFVLLIMQFVAWLFALEVTYRAMSYVRERDRARLGIN